VIKDLDRPEQISIFKKLGGGEVVLGRLHDIRVRVALREGVGFVLVRSSADWIVEISIGRC
jgi:hypothetical protein